ncbi:MAG: TonB-dependent receptor, partial [Bacteroidales bacterium]|nr:TonB-dependent receptor [Bacteroidales bacterium]
SNYEIGQKTKARYDNINLSIGYDYIHSGNILSVTFRDLYNNTPHAVSDRNSRLIQASNTFDIKDRTKSRSNNPSLDIYYQHEFTKDRHLFFDLIGTYINTKNDRLYRQSLGNAVQEITSHVDGNKYSAIAEVIYEQKIKDSRLSFGLRHQQMYTKNAYDGNTSSSVKMNTAESYAFGEWASTLGKLDYMVGVGVMRTYASQRNAKQVKYIFRPTIQLGYRFNNYLSIRYKAYMGGYAPSLAELSDVEQHIDIYQIRRGNPNLQAVRFFSNELSISVGTKYISAEWFTRYSYDDKPYMEETIYTNGLYVRTYANQRGFHRLNSQINLKIRPWKDYISILLAPFVNRYISNGNTYTHAHTNWGARANLMGMYKNWYVGANLETSFHSLWGETLNKNEKSHSIVFGYNREKWGIELQLQNIFSSRYEMSVENFSHLAPYNQMVWSRNLCKVFGIDFHFNLNFGKHGSEVNQRIHNSDTDAGIVPTTK